MLSFLLHLDQNLSRDTILSGNRFYHVLWAPGQLGATTTWEPQRNLGDYCAGVIADWFTAHPEWHQLDDVEVEGEIRCKRCNKRDFRSQMHLHQHTRRLHTPPVITGTLTYKRARLDLQVQAQSRLPRLVVDGIDFDNVWIKKWLGSFLSGDGDQEVMVQRQCDVMVLQFRKLESLLTD